MLSTNCKIVGIVFVVLPIAVLSRFGELTTKLLSCSIALLTSFSLGLVSGFGRTKLPDADTDDEEEDDDEEELLVEREEVEVEEDDTNPDDEPWES